MRKLSVQLELRVIMSMDDSFHLAVPIGDIRIIITKSSRAAWFRLCINWKRQGLSSGLT